MSPRRLVAYILAGAGLVMMFPFGSRQFFGAWFVWVAVLLLHSDATALKSALTKET